MKTLIAGFGNIFFSDDGFGCEVIRNLNAAEFPHDVTIKDFGISGIHLALEMSSGYELVVIADAIARSDAPGTVFAIEPCLQPCHAQPPPDAHAMDVSSVLALYERVCAQSGIRQHPKIIVAGCVPAVLDEGIGLTEAVRAAVPGCAQLIETLVHEHAGTGATV